MTAQAHRWRQITSRGLPPRSAWQPPDAQRFEALRLLALLSGIRLGELSRAYQIHRARITAAGDAEPPETPAEGGRAAAAPDSERPAAPTAGRRT